MPYSITDKNADCSGWAVVDPANKVFGCHTTKASAIKQAVAISLATDEPFVGERNADGDPVIICDIDGTLLNGKTLIQKTWNYVRSLTGALFIVTGRPESERDSTANDLHNAGVTYSRLIMNPGSSADSVEYKKATAEALLQTYDVVAAVENNPDALRAYRSLGIEAVNPASLPEGKRMAENRATPDELATGDFVAWLVETEAYAGQVVSVDGESTIVRVWDEDDECDCCEDCWEQGDLDAVVATIAIQKIQPLMTCQCDMMAIDPMTAELAGSTIIPTRDKWVRAAWAIKAKLEGFEERKIGSKEMRSAHVELRAEGDGRTFTGYAAVFGQPSLPLPFTEIVNPGAFKRSLQSRNRMMLLWNHDTSNPLASTRNGSLQMVEDARGLKVTATLPDTTLGRDIAELVRTGVVDAMSFGFSVRKDSWSQDGNTRYLEDVSLYEVSLVSTHAYEQTSGTVAVRSGDGLSADALQKLELGEELDTEQALLMQDVISRLTAGKVEETEGDVTALYKAKLALAEMV